MEKQNIDGQFLINDLLSSMGDGTLTPSEISEKVLYMMKKQEIEKKYHDLIKQRKDDESEKPERLLRIADGGDTAPFAKRRHSHLVNRLLLSPRFRRQHR